MKNLRTLNELFNPANESYQTPIRELLRARMDSDSFNLAGNVITVYAVRDLSKVKTLLDDYKYEYKVKEDNKSGYVATITVTFQDEAKTNRVAEGITGKHTMNEFKEKFDVSKAKNSLAGKVEALIGQMDRMPYDEIRSKFYAIVNDKETSASDKTRQKWNEVMNRAKSKPALMQAITNMYLAGAKMSVNDSESQKEKKLGRLTEFENWMNK